MPHHLTALAWTLWLCSASLQAALAAAMVGRGTWKQWPSLFAFLLALTLRDASALAQILVWHSPRVYFYSFWWLSLLASLLEIWLMVEIAVNLAGVTLWLRRMIAALIPGVASFWLALSLWTCLTTSIPRPGQIAFVVTKFDSAIGLAWLGTLLLMVLSVGVAGIQFTGSVRGICLGLVLESTAASTQSLLSALGVSDASLSQAHAVLFMVSLCIWLVTLGPERAERSCITYEERGLESPEGL